jgi:hypothetical protein
MGETQETITALTLLVTLFLSLLVFVIPRRYVMVPFAVAACWVPADQRIVWLSLNFHVLQILILAGAARLWLYGEIKPIRWNRFDRLFLVWAAVHTLVYVLQWMSLSAIVFMSGRLLEWLGLYWIFRQNLHSWKDLESISVVLAVCALAMAPFVALEWISGRNPFTMLGRVSTFTREGNFRCAATFPHAIIMGLFWVTLVPLFVGFAKEKRHRTLFWSAVVASVFMLWGTASSTPVLTLVVVAALVLAYPLRQYTRHGAWGVVGLLVVLQIVMKAPVWHLLSRVSVVSGSTGWHRYYLVNQAIQYFWEWALLGTRDTAHWGMGLADVTNQFVFEGVRGGFVSLVLFCVLLVMACRVFVRRSLRPTEKGESYLAWGVFVALIGHIVSFFGVAYFGQITMLWYLLLASAGCFYGRAQEGPACTGPKAAARGLQPAYR